MIALFAMRRTAIPQHRILRSSRGALEAGVASCKHGDNDRVGPSFSLDLEESFAVTIRVFGVSINTYQELGMLRVRGNRTVYRDSLNSFRIVENHQPAVAPTYFLEKSACTVRAAPLRNYDF